MKRTKHSLSHYKLTTFDFGKLVPVSCVDVLPGDSLRMSTSALLRVTPLLTPVMHPCRVRIHHWFVPYRILWDGWEDFITGGPDGMNNTVPPNADIIAAEGGFWDHIGIPPTTDPININTFPIKAYAKIWNEFYRDQDLQPEIPLDIPIPQTLQNIAWEKDYFTAARPWTQKGPEITVPLGTTAPVVGRSGGGVNNVPYLFEDGQGQGRYFSGRVSGSDATFSPNIVSDAAVMHWGASQTGLEADLRNATSANINELRLAFALQRYEEARAQYGSRYTEYLRYLGVRSSDARLQRPEYLGGGKTTINFSEVLRTGAESAATGENSIGEMFGHGIAATRSNRFIKFFEEHGVVLTLASIRPKSIYADGVAKQHTKKTKEDYWQKELEAIGQQAILNKEVYANSTNRDATFGYADRYAEYKSTPSGISAEFRNVLDDWHLARLFSSEPALNSTFVKCEPTKRVFAEQTKNSVWAMFQHSIQARRLVGNTTVGKIM
ncbi:MAG: major capsid protein [Microvirus sp.]|nr:MAG: major capsid protein [Microvirus sp.]